MCADCVAGSCHSSSHNDGWTCCGIELYTVKNHEYELNQIYKKTILPYEYKYKSWSNKNKDGCVCSLCHRNSKTGLSWHVAKSRESVTEQWFL